MNAIERVARDAVPAIADFCLVHVVRGVVIPCAAAIHVSRRGQLLLRSLMRHHVIRSNDLVSSVAHVVRTQRPLLRSRVHDEPRGDGRGEIAKLHRRLAARSVLVVPITAQRAVVGALSLCFAESGRSYTVRHLAPARRIAARIAEVLVPASQPAARHTPRRRPLARE